jgi:hypothetical protein
MTYDRAEVQRLFDLHRNKTVVANLMGLSTRTVGRVVGVQPRDPSRSASAPPSRPRTTVASLRAEVADLTAQLHNVLTRGSSRQPANPFLIKAWATTRSVSARDYSSAYHRSPFQVEMITYMGTEVRKSYLECYPQELSDHDFRSLHPVSPQCQEFPLPKDPPTDHVCDCPQCQEWRLWRLREMKLPMALVQTKADDVMYRCHSR